MGWDRRGEIKETAKTAKAGMCCPPQNIPKPPPPDAEARSEYPEGSGSSSSPPPGLNQYPTPSGSSSTMRTISYRTRFRDHILWPSGEAEVVGFGLGWSLGSILGRVSIFYWDAVLLTACTYLPADSSSLFLPDIPFPGGPAQISCPKEGGKTYPSPYQILWWRDPGLLPLWRGGVNSFPSP